jgi:thiol reductant ABC exporter CydD subunit
MTVAQRGAVDPRFLKYAQATRPFLVALILLGVVTGLLIIAQAWLIADVVARAFKGGAGIAQLRRPLGALLAVILARAAVAWGRDVLSHRSSARAKSQLRGALLEHVGALGPERLSEQRTGELAVLATRGIDALDGYFSLYLPQLCLAVIVPVAVLAVLIDRDWISALIVAGTLPLIPLFMGLVGASTRDRTELQLRTLQQLAGHFLDVVSGLTTLKVFGRAKAQIQAIGEVTDRYRVTAISTLRVTFLSSLILELVATISVAVVAVAVGLRLMSGQVDLRTALLVLLLAPEAYLPWRLLGANYHASAEGIGAARQIFAVLETPFPQRHRRTGVPNPALTGLHVENLRVEYPDRAEPALDGFSLALEPGEVLAVTGPSGCGKSTLLGVLLGFLEPQHGSVHIGDVDLAELDPEAWRAQVAWMPQRPHLFAASIEDNIRLGRPDASRDEVWEAVTASGLDAVVSKKGGLGVKLGEGGAGLSTGERQRVALARTFLRDAPLLLLDEPTANLDGVTEEQVLAALERLVRGRTVILVAHRPALARLGDRVLELGSAAAAA